MLTREIDSAAKADIEKFEHQLGLYLNEELEEDVFRVFRLNNGIYGQRQGGHNQMVRVKVPYGAVEPDHQQRHADRDAFSHLAGSDRPPPELRCDHAGLHLVPLRGRPRAPDAADARRLRQRIDRRQLTACLRGGLCSLASSR